MNQLYLACALLTDTQGRMLVVRKKKSTYFQMAGGKIDPGETPLETLRRECEEELSFDLSLCKVSFLGEHSAIAVNEASTQVNAHVFHVQLPKATPIQIAAEIEQAIWLTQENYHQYTLAHLLEEFSLPIWLNM